MVSVTLLSIITLLFQTICGFCIYNTFEDNTVFTITDARIDVRPDKLFRKDIYPKGIECCHFSDVDCSPNGKDDEENSFHIYFDYRDISRGSKRQLVHCTTGGALAIGGSYPNLHVDCKFANGTMVAVQMVTDELKKFDMTEHVN